MHIEHATEAGTFVYQDGVLVAVIKRDNESGKNLVYMAKEATSEQIASLIKSKTE